MKASKGFKQENDVIRLGFKSSSWLHLEEGTGGKQGRYAKKLEDYC